MSGYLSGEYNLEKKFLCKWFPIQATKTVFPYFGGKNSSESHVIPAINEQ